MGDERLWRIGVSTCSVEGIRASTQPGLEGFQILILSIMSINLRLKNRGYTTNFPKSVRSIIHKQLGVYRTCQPCACQNLWMPTRINANWLTPSWIFNDDEIWLHHYSPDRKKKTKRKSPCSSNILDFQDRQESHDPVFSIFRFFCFSFLIGVLVWWLLSTL